MKLSRVILRHMAIERKRFKKSSGCRFPRRRWWTIEGTKRAWPSEIQVPARNPAMPIR